LTVLQVALLNSSGVSLSAPGSLLSSARTAEASSTTLLMFGCLAAFGNEFAGQRPAGFYVSPDAPLRPLDAPFQRRDSQFVILDSQHHLIAGVDTQRLAKRSGDHHSAIFIDPQSGFRIHCHTFQDMTQSYHNVILDKTRQRRQFAARTC